MLVNGKNIFAGTENGVYLSSDNGTNWNARNNGFINVPVVYSLFSVGSYIFSGGTDFSGTAIYLSTDNAAYWSPVNDGLREGTGIYSMAVINDTLIGSTRNFGIYRRPLSEMVTDIKSSQNKLPTGYALQQNYPNPFNPITKIRYSVPSVRTHGNASVHLDVYDILGRKIATLVNKKQPPGNYSVEFNAEKLASGIYFYKMQVGNFVETKKLVLLK